MFKDVGQLVIKYLNELQTPTMPDGSPHPDYLSEANFLAELEYLETRDSLPAPELQAAKKSDAVTEESDRFVLTCCVEELVKLVNAGDHAAIQDFVDTILRPMRTQVSREANPPPGRNLAEDISGVPITVESVAQRANLYLAQGVVKGSIAGVLAEELGVSEATIYRRLERAAELSLIIYPETKNP